MCPHCGTNNPLIIDKDWIFRCPKCSRGKLRPLPEEMPLTPALKKVVIAAPKREKWKPTVVRCVACGKRRAGKTGYREGNEIMNTTPTPGATPFDHQRVGERRRSMTLFEAILKARRMKRTGAMQALNDKWQGRRPRKGTKKFEEYAADLDRAQEILQNA